MAAARRVQSECQWCQEASRCDSSQGENTDQDFRIPELGCEILGVGVLLLAEGSCYSILHK